MMELKIQDLHKSYKKQKVFGGENFCFKNGITVLIGANGMGKSTLINILSTALTMDFGHISLDGKDILSNLQEYRANLGFVPQNPPNYPQFTAYEYLEYISLLKNIEKKDICQEIERVLSVVRLRDIKEKRMKQLSGGMKQRLGIAQALLGNPKVLIFDEPTVGLDPKERLIFKNYLKNIARNKIIIVSTHIISDTENLADYVYMLKSGKIMFQGTIKEILNQVEDKGVETLDDIFLKIYD